MHALHCKQQACSLCRQGAVHEQIPHKCGSTMRCTATVHGLTCHTSQGKCAAAAKADSNHTVVQLSNPGHGLAARLACWRGPTRLLCNRLPNRPGPAAHHPHATPRHSSALHAAVSQAALQVSRQDRAPVCKMPRCCMHHTQANWMSEQQWCGAPTSHCRPPPYMYNVIRSCNLCLQWTTGHALPTPSPFRHLHF